MNDTPIVEGENSKVEGSINIVDKDTSAADQTVTVDGVVIDKETTIEGEYGNITVNPDGSFSYETGVTDAQKEALDSLGADDKPTESFDVKVTDNNNASDETTIDITINGSNDVPTLDVTNSNITINESADSTSTSGSFTAGNMVDGNGGQITITDKNGNSHDLLDENGNIKTDISIEGEYGTLTDFNYNPETGEVTYNYNQDGAHDHSGATDDKLVENFEITVTDNDGNVSAGDTATGNIQITINDSDVTGSNTTGDVVHLDKADNGVDADFDYFDGSADSSSLKDAVSGDSIADASWNWKDTYKGNFFENEGADPSQVTVNGFTIQGAIIQKGEYDYSTDGVKLGWREDNADVNKDGVKDYADGLGMTSGTGSDSHYEVGAGGSYDDGAKVEALIVKLPEGELSYGIDLSFGCLCTSGSNSADASNEYVVLEFYRDGELVYTIDKFSGSDDGSGIFDISSMTIPFDEVRIIPSEKGSDFVLTEVDFSQYSNTVVASGSGSILGESADGIESVYIESVTVGNNTVEIADGNTITLEDGTVLTFEEIGDGVFVALSGQGTDGESAYFTLSLDANGNWNMHQHEHFGDEINVNFGIKDTDGDTTSVNVALKGDDDVTISTDDEHTIGDVIIQETWTTTTTEEALSFESEMQPDGSASSGGTIDVEGADDASLNFELVQGLGTNSGMMLDGDWVNITKVQSEDGTVTYSATDNSGTLMFTVDINNETGEWNFNQFAEFEQNIILKVTATDSDGDSDEQYIEIKPSPEVDGSYAPLVNDSISLNEGAKAEGNLFDGDAISGGKITDFEVADGWTLTETVVDGETVFTLTYPVEIKSGVFDNYTVIVNENGDFIYKAPDALSNMDHLDVNAVLKYTVEDADGTIYESTVTFSSNAATNENLLIEGDFTDHTVTVTNLNTIDGTTYEYSTASYKNASQEGSSAGALAEQKLSAFLLGENDDKLEITGKVGVGTDGEAHHIYGDELYLTKDGGDDVITVGELASGGHIRADGNVGDGLVGGDDTINVGTMSANKISSVNEISSKLLGDGWNVSLGGKGGDDTINFTGKTDASGNTVNQLLNGEISGDSMGMGSGSSAKFAEGGDDTLNLQNTTVTGSRIYGDASSMGAYAEGGDDTVNVGTLNNSYLFGDGYTMNTASKGGNDTIDVDTLNSGYVVGDGYTMNSASKGGDDSITVDSVKGGAVLGDGFTLNSAVAGNDTITIDSQSSGKVFGDGYSLNSGSQGGNDTINVESYTGKGFGQTYITGDAYTISSDSQGGDDTINIDTMSGQSVYGDAYSLHGKGGDDTYNIENMVDGSITGDGSHAYGTSIAGDDTFNIENMSGGIVYGDSYQEYTGAQSGNDTIRVDNMTGGTIYADSYVGAEGGDDTIIIDNYHGGSIDGGKGFDVLSVGNASVSDVLSNSNISGMEMIIAGEGYDNSDREAMFDDLGILQSDESITLDSSWEYTGDSQNGGIYSNGETEIWVSNSQEVTLQGPEGAESDMGVSVFGTEGNDFLFGGEGDDMLYGGEEEIFDEVDGDMLLGEGSDVLDGGAGDDVLVGGVQEDILLGGTGSDTLVGGEGEDQFTWKLEDFAHGDVDVAVDFNVDEDTLDLSELKTEGYTFEVVENAEINGFDIIVSNGEEEAATQTITLNDVGETIDKAALEQALNDTGMFGA